MSAGKILVVDDDSDHLFIVEKFLSTDGYEVRTASNGIAGISLAKNWRPHLIILEIMMPDLDGIEVCKIIQKFNHEIRIIMLTSLSDEKNKVMALDSGADEYFTKPLLGLELLARVRAMFRRIPKETDKKKYYFGDVHIDVEKREVWRNERHISLTAREFDILLYFARHPYVSLDRELLMEKLWGIKESDVGTRRIDNFISSLRKLIEPDPANPIHIITIPKVGFKFIPNA